MGRRLDGKVAVVTGASRGIGRAISVAFGAERATVVLAARSREKLAETADLIHQAGGRGDAIPVDLADEAAIKNLVKVVQDRFGRLDILVNNAGVTHSAMLDELHVRRAAAAPWFVS